ncbi:MAG: hypothetical protein K5694_02625 [Bacilli bacterium]|nr:hypothetical protein [Bacilli bacterium]
MKKKSFIFLCSALGALTLVGCNNSAATSDSYQSSYTVEYFDDAATPTRVGYAYVAINGEAPIRPLNASNYDYLSRQAETPLDENNRPLRLSFEKFVGYYDEEKTQPVDFSHITADCKVYAAFKSEKMMWTPTFYNGSDVIEGFANRIAYDNATVPTFPTDVHSLSTHWYEKDNLDGFYFTLDNSKALFHQDDISFAYGNAAPETPTKGTIFCDYSIDSDLHHKFPVKVYNGTSWIDLGNLYDGFTPFLKASFSYQRKDFVATFYDSSAGKIDVNSPLNASIPVTWGNALTYVIGDTANADGKFETVFSTSGKADVTVVTNNKPTSWAGVYTEGDNYKGEAVDLSSVKQTSGIYPLY